MNTDDEKELAAWRAGPWVLKSEHDRILSMTREQLTKALVRLAATIGGGSNREDETIHRNNEMV